MDERVKLCSSGFCRWAKLRINMLPATIIEPISECFVASLIIGWSAHHMFRWDIMVFFMCHCLAWFISDYIQLRGVQVTPTPDPRNTYSNT